MEINTTTLLPYILYVLSRKPTLSSTIEELTEQLTGVVKDEVISPFGTLERAVEFAIETGVNLGVLTLKDQRVKQQFKVRQNHRAAKTNKMERAKAKKSKPHVSAKAKSRSQKRRPPTKRGVQKRGTKKSKKTTRSRKQ